MSELVMNPLWQALGVALFLNLTVTFAWCLYDVNREDEREYDAN